jgi:hypothetical protein
MFVDNAEYYVFHRVRSPVVQGSSACACGQGKEAQTIILPAFHLIADNLGQVITLRY